MAAIVGYTHTCTALTAINENSNIDANPTLLPRMMQKSMLIIISLIHRRKKQPRKCTYLDQLRMLPVMTFRRYWFSKFDMALRGIRVGFKAFLGVIHSSFRSSTDAGVR